MTVYDKIKYLQKHMGTSSYATRILCQLNYAISLSDVHGKKYADIIDSAANSLIECVMLDGVITRSAALSAEQMLLPMRDDAKKYKVHCACHAHIDMNWIWGFQETVSVTVDTFRTMLDLMDEYPEMKFSQSQASTYEIIEKYAPSMLPEIKARIKEGRWEVTASTWVEPDKNMPSGESLARHILYTKRYLSELLEIPAESLELDFEPDTFGHNISVPDICAAGGVKYYYHCRGTDAPEHAYIWRGRAGGELLVFRNPHWYGERIDPNMLRDTAYLCEKAGVDCTLNDVGLGDHGGGPSRRDIETLIEMSYWPIMPTIIFSTYSDFFRELDKFRERLPVKTGEINFVFDGCYTSQAKIKMSNRIAEDRMYEAEALGAESYMLGGENFKESFASAWKNILFNHFHDILPGSGIVDTREHAMGRFQDAMAHIGTNANLSMREIAKRINTEEIPLEIDPDSISVGSGAGYNVNHRYNYNMPCAERGMGKLRLFHLFNPTQYDFDGVIDITVFEWDYENAFAVFKDSCGEVAPHKLTENGSMFWGHKYKKFAVSVKVPAFGYSSYTLDVAPTEAADNKYSTKNPRQDRYTGDDIILENTLVRAAFDHRTMQLKSFVDKKTGRELVKAPACTFRMITENTVQGMSAWRIGDYMTIDELNESCDIRVYDIKTDGIRKWLKFDFPFASRSKGTVCVSLDENSAFLEFNAMIDFHEIGVKDKFVPLLAFKVPFAYDSDVCRFDVPFGTIDRKSLDFDVPASSFAVPLDKNGGSSLMLISDSKYGFRYASGAISMSLIRASYHPDPYPEYGIHRIRIGVGIMTDTDNAELYRNASAFVHPISYCTANLHERGGDLPLDGRFVEIEGNIKITAVKTAEDGEGTVIRFFNAGDKDEDFRLTFKNNIVEAYYTDVNENRLNIAEINGCSVVGTIKPYEIKTVLIKS